MSNSPVPQNIPAGQFNPSPSPQPVTPERQSGLGTKHEAVYQELLKEQTPPQQEPPSQEPAPQQEQPKAHPPAPVEPLIFGKYKTMEEAEKGYKEAERQFHAKAQEAAEVRKQFENVKQYVDFSKLSQGTQQQAATKVEDATQQIDMLDLLVNDPARFKQELLRDTLQNVDAYINARQQSAKWETENPDLAPYTHLVSAEVMRLINSDPELARDPNSVLGQATQNFRTMLGQIRADGQKQAVQAINETRGSVISAVPQSGDHGTPSGVPISTPEGETFDEYIKRRQSEFRKHVNFPTGATGPLQHPVGR